jgi:long-chain acyl-CoA synthetase
MLVPVNWHFTAEELAYVIGNSESKVLFAATPFLETAAAAVARGETPTLRRCIVIGGSVAGFDDYEALIAASSNEAVEGKFLGGPMFYTSGTTGRPKGVRSASRGAPPQIEMIEMMGAGLTAMLSIPADGVTLICGPVYHSAQWAFSYLPMIAGSTVVMRHRFDAAEVH